MYYIWLVIPFVIVCVSVCVQQCATATLFFQSWIQFYHYNGFKVLHEMCLELFNIRFILKIFPMKTGALIFPSVLVWIIWMFKIC